MIYAIPNHIRNSCHLDRTIIKNKKFAIYKNWCNVPNTRQWWSEISSRKQKEPEPEKKVYHHNNYYCDFSPTFFFIDQNGNDDNILLPYWRRPTNNDDDSEWHYFCDWILFICCSDWLVWKFLGIIEFGCFFFGPVKKKKYKAKPTSFKFCVLRTHTHT